MYANLQDLVLAGVRWELAQDIRHTAYDAAPEHEIKKDVGDKPNMPYAICPVPSVAPTMAANVDDIRNTESLLHAISDFNHPLKQFAKNTVLPSIETRDKRQETSLLIITDMPSADDDENGRILTGAAGELLDRMLAAVELSRDDICITPLVFWRTAGGTTPSASDLELARPFVSKLIEVVRPSAILTLGTLSATEIAGAKLPACHGIQSTFHNIPVNPIFHPNYLLLKPDAKRDVWTALQSLQKILKNQ